MVDFETPLGLRSTSGQLWNINVETDSDSDGNLTFNANSITGGATFLEINDETGNIGISRSPSDMSKVAIQNIDGDGALFLNTNGLTLSAITNNSSATAAFFLGAETAATFLGDIEINGELINSVSVVIFDNPLDPANQFLKHANIGSSEMLNVYSGNATLDENGEAWIELPEWVESVNHDFRYQLTCVGGSSAVYIAKEVSSNRFKIAGDIPKMKISWQLTGVRKDPWALSHPLVVEKAKATNEQGFYQHPQLYSQPVEKGISFAQYPDVMQQLKEDEKRYLADKS